MSLFPGSQGVTVNGGNLVGIKGSGNNVSFVVDDKRKREGIELLLKFCVRQAIHDSSARGDLGCHPGTREEYIRNITRWGNGQWSSDSEKRAFLMTGPAGAGKSAIARTCAYSFKESGNLGASFFFYRPSGWNDPMKFIPTIVYQLTTRYPAYRDVIDAIVLDDRLVLQKAMDDQFQELLVEPLMRLNDEGRGVGKDTVIIVDGLDECANVEAQIEIINLVATSILQRTTPFLWAFFSRPEPPITSAFSSDAVTKICWKLPLTLSSNGDNDIEAYIRASFGMIRAKHSIPSGVAWPKEVDIRCLVSQSAGLFVYPVIAMRYIGNGTTGLEQRLRLVLQLDSASSENPFSVLDQLYRLVMMQIPEGVLFDAMSLLFLDQCPRGRVYACFGRNLDTYECHSALGLSSAAFYAAISNLYSVLGVKESDSWGGIRLQFYHKSFIDFLLDRRRSEKYFLQSPNVFRHCLKMLVQAMAATDGSQIYKDDIYSHTIQLIFGVVEDHGAELDMDILEQMSQLDWSCPRGSRGVPLAVDIRSFVRKVRIPKSWRRKIIRPYRQGLSDIRSQVLATINPEKYEASAYIIGSQGKKACILRCISDGDKRYRMHDILVRGKSTDRL